MKEALKPLLFSVSSLLTAMLAFALLPIIAKNLGADRFGQYSSMILYVNAFSQLMLLGVTSYITIPRVWDNQRILQGVVGQWMGFCLICLLLGGALIAVGGLEFIYLIIFVSAGRALNLLSIQYARNAQRFLWYVVFQFGTQLIALAIVIALSLSPNIAGEKVYFYAYQFLFVYLFLNVYLFKIKYKSLPKLIGTRDIPAIHFGVNSIAHSFMAIVIGSWDKFLLEYSLPSEQFAVYALAGQFSAVFIMLFSTVWGAYVPTYFRMLDSSEDGRQIFMKLGIGVFSFLFLVVLASFFLIGEIIKLFFGAEYQGAIPNARILIIAAGFQCMYIFSSSIYTMKQKMGQLSTISALLILVFTSVVSLFFFQEEGGGVAKVYTVIWMTFAVVVTLRAWLILSERSH